MNHKWLLVSLAHGLVGLPSEDVLHEMVLKREGGSFVLQGNPLEGVSLRAQSSSN